jgi:WD40 repeat protein
VAEGLAHAHKQGVLHRDVKPSNLLLDAQGTVWITDFGLAKAEGAEELTSAGDIVGTIRFMAPERFEGRSLPQSDVYALGATLYEMLTLRPAFDDTNKVKLIDKVLHEPALSPRKIDANIPRDLETIVLKCLAKEPGERYASAVALADDLKRFLADRPIRARRSTVAEQTWRWCRRNPVVASLLGAIAALLVVVTIASLLTAAAFDRKRRQADEAAREARLREADALVGEAHGIRLSRRPGQRFRALEALKKAAYIGRELDNPPAWFDHLRNEAIAAMALPDVHVTREWDACPPDTLHVDVTQDLELYVRSTHEGAVTVRRVKDDSEVVSWPACGEPVSVVCYTGRLLVLRGEHSHRAQLFDLTNPHRGPLFDKKAVHGVSIRRDGKLLAWADDKYAIHVIDLADGRVVHGIPPGRVKAPPLLHPTAPFVVVSSYFNTKFEIRDLRDGRSTALVDPPWPMGMGGPDWSPDGRTLAMPAGDSGQIQLYAFDPDTGTLRATRMIDGPPDAGLQVVFHPRGDRLAARGWGDCVRLFDVPTGRHLFSTHGFNQHWGLFRFDSAGGRLIGARVGELKERIGVWSVADAREYRALGRSRPDSNPAFRFAVHPNGRLAAEVVAPDGVAIFDIETGAEVARIPFPRRGILGNPSLAFDGTGALLTNEFNGFLRWPCRGDPACPGRYTFGPPEPLPFHPGHLPIAASDDGRVVVQAMWTGYGMAEHAGGWILHPNSTRPRWVERGGSINAAQVSNDGRLAVFNGIVYETATGKCLWRSPNGAHSRLTPDGRLLISMADGGRVYTVGTWEPGVRVGGGHPHDVSPDGRLVVLALQRGSWGATD